MSNIFTKLKVVDEDFIHIGKNVTIEEGAIIGYDFINVKRGGYSKHVYIGDNSIIKFGAIICAGVKIGKNCVVNNYAFIRENVDIGDDCIIGPYVQFDGDAEVGDGTLIYTHCYITWNMKIGKNVFIGPCCRFANDKIMAYKRPQLGGYEMMKGATIGDGARIGMGTVCAAGINIGKESVIGLGSVITHDVPDYTIVYGNPGKIMGEVPEGQFLR